MVARACNWMLSGQGRRVYCSVPIQPFGSRCAPDRFNQVAHATDSICFSSVLAFPVRRLRTSLLCFLPPVARRRLFFLFSFLSFRVVFLSPSPLPVCLVGLSVGWCVGLLVCRVVGVGSVPFRCFAFCPPPRSDVSNKSGVTKWVLSLANWATRLPEVI